MYDGENGREIERGRKRERENERERGRIEKLNFLWKRRCGIPRVFLRMNPIVR